MTVEEKAAKLAEYIRGSSDFRIVTEIDGNYGHLGATIADAVLQANMKYETHVRPRIRRIRASFPAAATLPGLKRTLMQETTTRFLDWGGADRVRRFDDIVDLFSSESIETEDDLRGWLLNERNLPKLAAIKGVGPKTIDYFQILVGLQTCAIDRRLLDFLEQADVAVSGYDEARTIINLTADILGVKRAYLDHSIWEHIGKQGPKACK
jgi:thermostable 8-oxoguanine DNA glycosylase